MYKKYIGTITFTTKDEDVKDVFVKSLDIKGYVYEENNEGKVSIYKVVAGKQ